MTLRHAPLRSIALTPAGLRLFALLLVIVLAGSGCARFGKIFKGGDVDEGQPVEQLYDKAHRSMTNGNWSAGEATYKRLVAQYPYGPYTEQALVEIAYAQYKAGKHDDAVSSIDRFIRTYPTHRNTAYMYYLRGLVNSSRDTVFLQKVWRLDASRRDLATPMQAYNDFSIVADRYPNSRYAATLAAAYTALGNETLAADAKRVLQQNAPAHPYLSGDWPDYPSNLRKLNPLAGEKSALDND